MYIFDIIHVDTIIYKDRGHDNNGSKIRSLSLSPLSFFGVLIKIRKQRFLLTILTVDGIDTACCYRDAVIGYNEIYGIVLEKDRRKKLFKIQMNANRANNRESLTSRSSFRKFYARSNDGSSAFNPLTIDFILLWLSLPHRSIRLHGYVAKGEPPSKVAKLNVIRFYDRANCA